MSGETLGFPGIEINQDKYRGSKPPIILNSEDINKRVTFEKFKNSEKGFNYFIGNPDDIVIGSLYIMSP